MSNIVVTNQYSNLDYVHGYNE